MLISGCTTLAMLIALLGERAARADDVMSEAPTGTFAEQTFRGKLSADAGMWKWGHITLTDAAIVVETHHFPFRVDTEGIEYDGVSSEFKSSRGLFRGSVTFKTTKSSVKILCPAKESKALTEALKARTLARKKIAAPSSTVPKTEEKKPQAITITVQ